MSHDTSDDDRWIDVLEAGELLGWQPFKVYYYLSLDRLPGAKKVEGVWKIDRERMLEAQRAGLLR